MFVKVFKCFQVFLQVFRTYVVSASAISDVCCMCFIQMLQKYMVMAVHICFKCMFETLQSFHTYVANVLSGYCICWSDYTYML